MPFENYDPENPKDILFEDIQAATERIAGTVINTPCEKAKISDKYEMQIYLKQEFLQFTGRERGIINSLILLPEAEKQRGLITATIGNLGISLSYHCSLLGIPCTLVMPENVAIYKYYKCLDFGAKIILFGASYKEAKTQAMIISDDKKIFYLDGYDHPYMIEGNGSIGIEIVEQVPDVDAILVPVGAGTLLAGIAVAVKNLKPETEIYGIETNKTCSMGDSLRLERRVSFEVVNSLACDLSINKVGLTTLHNIKNLVDKMVIVQEDWIARAVAHIVHEEKFVVEGGAAAGVAAIMAGQFAHLRSKNVVCILTEGNIDPTILVRVVQRGLAADGRLLKFKVTLRDRPGELALLCAYLARVGVVLRDCKPMRIWFRSDVYHLELQIIVETKGWNHANELVTVLRKNYQECYFFQEQDSLRTTNQILRSTCLAPEPLCMKPMEG